MKVVANSVLTLLDYDERGHTLVPQVEKNTRYALPLDECSLYEAFGRGSKWKHGAPTTYMDGINSFRDAHRKIDDVIGRIFDIQKIAQLCDEEGMVFRNR